MAQRVLIAGAVSCEPDLLIADEPTTALDVTVQAEVLDLLRYLQDEFHMGVILVTHNFGVVADLCDRVSVMRRGRIVETGPARAIFDRPEHPYTQQLLARHPARRSPADRSSRRAASTAAAASKPGRRSADPADGHIVMDDHTAARHPRRRRRLPGKGFRSQPFRALKGVSIDIRRARCVGLVGESGSGKTTLGRAVLGLAPVTGGEMLYKGRDIAHLSRGERRRWPARSRSCSRTPTPR